MKTFKPSVLSLLTRCFEFRGQHRLALTGMVMIELGEDRREIYLERDLWTFWSTRLEAREPLDEGFMKSRAEFLVSAKVTNHGEHSGACAVDVQVGAIHKKLLVFGDRYWHGTGASAPSPLESPSLDWTLAYGGAGVAENPVGKGAVHATEHGSGVHWLPNIEDPLRPMAFPHDRVKPMGLGPIDPMWPQRTGYAGTYDNNWLQTQFPAIASNTDWRYFNRAPADQQQDEPFTGSESYAFGNLHPTRERLTGKLPDLCMRAFVGQQVDQEVKFREVRTRLNTVWFFPDAERAILVFQGFHPIVEDDGADILHLVAALETIGNGRTAEHYLDVRDKRLDKHDGMIESLREDALLPAGFVVPIANFADKENRALERAQRRAHAERARARAEVSSHGLDPDEHAPPAEVESFSEVRTVDDLIRLRADVDRRMGELKQQADVIKDRSMAEVRSVLKARNQDVGLVEREMAGLELRGPPRPFVDTLLDSFRQQIVAGQLHKAGVAELEQMVVDQKLHARWRAGEDEQLRAYRLTAHYQPPADREHAGNTTARRFDLMVRLSEGKDFRGLDLTGADLSGMDLTAVNLEGALLESANLTGTILKNANLHNAVLAHAELVSTDLRQANLSSANLGGTRVQKSDFSGADLTRAIFDKARLAEVSWRKATLDDVSLVEAHMQGIDCSGAQATQMLTFIKLDLRGFNFAGARIKLAAFIECDVSGVDFSEAAFEKCAFVSLKAAGTRFAGMRVDSGCFAQDCDLRGADFSRAVLPNMSFRGARLDRAVFQGARIHGSDFSECNFTDADLSQADAHEARFVRAQLVRTRFDGANLMDAVLQHAFLEDTDFGRANLFQSDFARVRVGPGVRFEDALLTRMRTYPRHRAPSQGVAAS